MSKCRMPRLCRMAVQYWGDRADVGKVQSALTTPAETAFFTAFHPLFMKLVAVDAVVNCREIRGIGWEQLNSRLLDVRADRFPPRNDADSAGELCWFFLLDGHGEVITVQPEGAKLADVAKDIPLTVDPRKCAFVAAVRSYRKTPNEPWARYVTFYPVGKRHDVVSWAARVDQDAMDSEHPDFGGKQQPTNPKFIAQVFRELPWLTENRNPTIIPNRKAVTMLRFAPMHDALLEKHAALSWDESAAPGEPVVCDQRLFLVTPDGKTLAELPQDIEPGGPRHNVQVQHLLKAYKPDVIGCLVEVRAIYKRLKRLGDSDPDVVDGGYMNAGFRPPSVISLSEQYTLEIEVVLYRNAKNYVARFLEKEGQRGSAAVAALMRARDADVKTVGRRRG